MPLCWASILSIFWKVLTQPLCVYAFAWLIGSLKIRKEKVWGSVDILGRSQRDVEPDLVPEYGSPKLDKLLPALVSIQDEGKLRCHRRQYSGGVLCAKRNGSALTDSASGYWAASKEDIQVWRILKNNCFEVIAVDDRQSEASSYRSGVWWELALLTMGAHCSYYKLFLRRHHYILWQQLQFSHLQLWAPTQISYLYGDRRIQAWFCPNQFESLRLQLLPVQDNQHIQSCFWSAVID